MRTHKRLADNTAISRSSGQRPTVVKHHALLQGIKNGTSEHFVEWTVRNHGEDADWRSDLGHRRIGVRLLAADEHTAYIGTHFMDCVVRFNGQVFAVRRVPVTVRDVQHNLRSRLNPRTPNSAVYGVDARVYCTCATRRILVR